jgi:hypothetical protein
VSEPEYLYRLDVNDIEDTLEAAVVIIRTPSWELARGYPEGVIVGFDRVSLGDVHFSWDHLRRLHEAIGHILSPEGIS